jgi:hypothetical protein
MPQDQAGDQITKDQLLKGIGLGVAGAGAITGGMYGIVDNVMTKKLGDQQIGSNVAKGFVRSRGVDPLHPINNVIEQIFSSDKKQRAQAIASMKNIPATADNQELIALVDDAIKQAENFYSKNPTDPIGRNALHTMATTEAVTKGQEWKQRALNNIGREKIDDKALKSWAQSVKRGSTAEKPKPSEWRAKPIKPMELISENTNRRRLQAGRANQLSPREEFAPGFQLFEERMGQTGLGKAFDFVTGLKGQVGQGVRTVAKNVIPQSMHAPIGQAMQSRPFKFTSGVAKVGIPMAIAGGIVGPQFFKSGQKEALAEKAAQTNAMQGLGQAETPGQKELQKNAQASMGIEKAMADYTYNTRVHGMEANIELLQAIDRQNNLNGQFVDYMTKKGRFK